MANGFEFFPQRCADFFNHIEAWKPACQVYANTDHDQCGKDLQYKVSKTGTDIFHYGLAKGPGDSPGQGIADQTTKIEYRGIAEQAQAVVANLFGQAHGQGTDDAAAHTQTVDSAKQADDKGVKYTQGQRAYPESVSAETYII